MFRNRRLLACHRDHIFYSFTFCLTICLIRRWFFAYDHDRIVSNLTNFVPKFIIYDVYFFLSFKPHISELAPKWSRLSRNETNMWRFSISIQYFLAWWAYMYWMFISKSPRFISFVPKCWELVGLLIIEDTGTESFLRLQRVVAELCEQSLHAAYYLGI